MRIPHTAQKFHSGTKEISSSSDLTAATVRPVDVRQIKCQSRE